jgi:hypothetical protein
MTLRSNHIVLVAGLIGLAFECNAMSAKMTDSIPMPQRIEQQVGSYVGLLKRAAQQHPSPETFRKVMKPLVGALSGFREATLLSPEFVIHQVYHKRHAAGVGFDLRTVETLKPYLDLMVTSLAPQISGPSKAGLFRSSYIAVRHPIVEESTVTGCVSLMVSTKSFLKAVGLSECRAYRISCPDGGGCSQGVLSSDALKITVALPSMSWTIEYDPIIKDRKQEE